MSIKAMCPLHKLLLCTQYYANFNSVYYIYYNTLHEYIHII